MSQGTSSVSLLPRSRIGEAGPWDRWDRIALSLALGLTAWVFAFKVTAYRSLAYTDDMFMFAQLATSWLDGHLLADNHYGNNLCMHTYFAALPLGAFVKPLGPPGLFLALAIATGAASFTAMRILRLLGVPGKPATIFGVALVASPLGLHHVHDWIYGFQVELLVPSLALALFYALLRRRLGATIAATLALLSVKEEMTLLVGILGLLALVEDRLAIRPDDQSAPRKANVPALVAMAMSVVALPIFLHVMRAQTVDVTSVDGFARLKLPTALHEPIHNGRELVAFFFRHVLDWLGSRALRWWLVVAALGSLGLAALRPHLVPLGVALSLVSWLMDDGSGNDGILWPWRLAAPLAFAWCLALLGFASLWRHLASAPTRRQAILAAAPFALFALGAFSVELKILPASREVYLFAGATPGPPTGPGYDAAERADAEKVYARYVALSSPGEPTAAAPYLYRYARYRDLLWHQSLVGHPRPVWILWDEQWKSIGDYGMRAADYVVVAREGRFTLRHARAR